MEKRWNLVWIVFASIVAYLLPIPVGHDGRVVLAVLVFAALMWVTETVPLYLTSLLITILVVVTKVFTFKEAVVVFADPILALFFGGFLIARAMQDVHLDKRLAMQICNRFKDDKHALLGMMFVTAFLSMWISNTSTTILMIPIAIGIVHRFKKKMPNFQKAAVLGIAYSANIGGVGTILGSPPNAIAVSKLLEISAVNISFLDWMKATLPIVVILIPIAWYILIKTFPFADIELKKSFKLPPMSDKQKLFDVVFVITVLLFMTTKFTGLSSSLVAMMSAVALFMLGILKPGDVNRINYSILILFGGGLVLGSAMFKSGLSEFFTQGLASVLTGTPSFVVMLGVILLAMALSALASNTATSAILIPIILPLAELLNLSPRTMGLLAGVAVSLVYVLPVSTPPNAIAYASGHIQIKDMMKAGSLLTVVSIVVLLAFGMLW